MRNPNHRESQLTLSELLSEGVQPWTVDDLRRATGAESVALDDALADLERWGLVHRQGIWIVPSRAAVQFDRLFGSG
jgi:DNA-binding HxlR family transcriptional regulator